MTSVYFSKAGFSTPPTNPMPSTARRGKPAEFENKRCKGSEGLQTGMETDSLASERSLK